MKKLLAILLLLSLPVFSATLEERRAELENDADVIVAKITTPATAVPNFPTLEVAEITYYGVTGGVIRPNTVALYIWNGAAYWAGREPSVLRVVPVIVPVATEAQVQSKIDQLAPGGINIIFNIGASVATVTGLWDNSGTLEDRTYVLYKDGGVVTIKRKA